ncbi:uncharacterized protein RCC_03892 [Ramularia collo-cygni]|uniref:Hydrophobin n=1 Tax=Ramularia collo-cygni TaxID=112498 RepID=A0A2D3V6A3_9PEZI|nr:uncharacterized protein RCC_03892 [Ramularia collo-cygni]CZT18054.1 uncharacterized protein RCC_03892 [Ramularia collo-cygni]
MHFAPLISLTLLALSGAEAQRRVKARLFQCDPDIVGVATKPYCCKTKVLSIARSDVKDVTKGSECIIPGDTGSSARCSGGISQRTPRCCEAFVEDNGVCHNPSRVVVT